MGMYTRLTFWAEVKPGSPAMPILKHLADAREALPEPLPDHPLFSTQRWTSLLGSSSYYHNTHESRFIYDDIAKGWFLNIDASLKNYDGEIRKFLDWFAPYDAQYDGFCGFWQYEEDEQPTLIYRVGDRYEFHTVHPVAGSVGAGEDGDSDAMTSEQPPEWVKAPDHPGDWSARIVRQPPAVGTGIVAFIEARLKEREAFALAAPGRQWTATEQDSVAGAAVYDEQWLLLYPQHYDHDNALSNKPDATGPMYIERARDALCAHIAANDPRRVLAAVAKDRAILALHQPDTMMSGQTVCGICFDDDDRKWESVPAQYPCQTVRLLAAIDADHPDYDPDWKPVAT